MASTFALNSVKTNVAKTSTILTFKISKFSTAYSWMSAVLPKEKRLPFDFAIDAFNRAEHFGYVMLYFHYSGQKQQSMRYRLSILDKNGIEHCAKEHLWTFVPQKVRTNMTNYAHYHLCEQYLIKGSLTFNLEVELVSANDTAELDSKSTLLKNYQTLLENGQLSDVTFIVNGREFVAHKAILGAHSPVFAAMFSHDLKEKLEGRVELSDISVEAFEQLLRYFYTGALPDLKKRGVEMFMAADKYQLDLLKEAARSELEQLNVENVSAVLLLADQHQLVDLRKACINYFMANSSAIIETDNWKQVAANPELVMEMFMKLAINSYPSKK